MLYVALAIHVAVSFGLIFLVLLHSGRGGGLSDMFGGGLGTTAAGSTVVEKNLDRMTIVCSIDLRVHHHRAGLDARSGLSGPAARGGDQEGRRDRPAPPRRAPRHGRRRGRAGPVRVAPGRRHGAVLATWSRRLHLVGSAVGRSAAGPRHREPISADDSATMALGIRPIDSLDPADVVPTSQSAMVATDLLFDSLMAIDPATGDAVPCAGHRSPRPTTRRRCGPSRSDADADVLRRHAGARRPT